MTSLESEFQKTEKILSDYCDSKVPQHLKNKLRIEYAIDSNSAILYERRPRFMDKSVWTKTPVAKFRYIKTKSKWHLYWSDRNGKWHLSEFVKPTKNFSKLLDAVEEDETCIFWG